ncbi:MAG TPA: hypothetical protein PKL73_15365 [Polyangiaceae bacterium]|nr:MAG: hypothetical protein BWY17_03032 [Deltaproteobacteria bacterium ADurb.Bin207]HNS98330.1 hypothetical protein [Polyangiaceae bacterium]HNZ23245.1 hypothetical protein [Polyangiaceae bacterium]HOD23321.1 hypothetical protein [Polyangiaceae bacterium]HOE51316.1 hypothetical protein [Polyangiaceae bacterium]
MRSINTLTTLSATALALTLATGAQAQPGDPAPAPATAQPANPGLSLSFGGSSSSTAPVQDSGAQPTDEEKKEAEQEKLPWRGTSLTLDQSFTTQTVNIGDNVQSDNPLYEMNLSFRPRYYFFEQGPHSLQARLRLEAFRELTNADYTTRDQETQIGNTTLDVIYTAKLYNADGFLTSVGIGPRILFPTNKYTYRGGNRLRIGGGVKAAQGVPLAGENATWFPSASFEASLYYMKYINASTTSTNDDFSRERQDAGGRTVVSNQFSGRAKVSHELTPLVGAALDITDKLHLSTSYVWILHWAYGFDDTEIDITTGKTTPNRVDDPQTYRVTPWFLAGLDYDIIPEVGVGIGYYNATDQIGPEGTRRNPLWSPDARLFFDITANLDEIYTTASGNRKNDAANRGLTRQQARANNIGTW